MVVTHQQDESESREALPVECPSDIICSLTKDPLVNGCTFNIPTPTGQISKQVFEYSCLFRMIATQGILKAYRFVQHPIFDAKIHREHAMTYVHSVSPEMQDRMNQERLRLFHSLEEE